MNPEIKSIGGRKRRFGVGVLLLSLAAVVIYFDWFAEPGEGASGNNQEVAATAELRPPPPPLLASINEAQIDPALVGYEKPNGSARLLEVKGLRARDWRVGDELAVVIPHTGYTLQTRIEEVEETLPGITTIKSYPDETMANHVLLTVSSKNTFMSLFTPDGEYELVGGQEYGWLVPSSSLPGPTHDDFVLVEDPVAIEPPPQVEPVPFDG